jgi:hypothetical protein
LHSQRDSPSGEPLSPNLTFLANRFGSDKGDAVGNAHNFTLLYAFLLEAWRNDEFCMLELGLQRGDGNPLVYLDPYRLVSDVPSVRMWLGYFPRARCIGFDAADFTGITIPRFEFIRGNLSEGADLKRLAQLVPSLRLVVDDASHASYHQQCAFVYLFDKVEPNGFYIIEDLDYQPPYETQLPETLKTYEVFERFLLSNKLTLPEIDAQRADALAAQIRSIFIHRNCSPGPAAGSMKLIAIQKS